MSERIDYLVRLLAQARLEGYFERIYGVVFGSQIEFLRELNSAEQCTISDAKKVFSQIAEEFAEFYKDFTFEQWISFLTNFEVAKEENGYLQITDLGRDFLLFLLAKQRTEKKPY